MSSDVLESILTPRNSPHLAGHAEAESSLLSTWYSNKIPHAWLISGPQGIGKATLAYRFARFVLSQDGESDNLFGLKAENLALDSEHPTFRRVVAGSHGDLLVLEMKDGKDISVEEARKVAGFLRLTPSESKWRVVIIDSVDHMNRNAANAILKILEEPPSNVLILLISHLPGKIIPTIRSRCRQLRMYPLAQEEFSEVLSLTSSDIQAQDTDKLYKIARGAPGMGLDLYEKGGLDYYAKIIGILERLPRLDSNAVHALGDEVSGRGDVSSWRMFEYMFGYFFHQLTLQAAGQKQEAIAPGEQEAVQTMLEKSPLETWLELWEKIRQSMNDVIRINLDKKHVVINIFTVLEQAFRH